MSEKIREEMRRLESMLVYHSKLYYEQDDPEISDEEYDRLFARLAALEKEFPQLASPNSPTQRVGGKVSEKFEKVKHEVPMDSFGDIFSEEETEEFVNKILESYPDADFVVEQKFDGLSVSLEYENGLLKRGLTRGDGIFGEDVTENVKTIKNVPIKLTRDVEKLIVRGEVFMPRRVFARLNEKRDALGEKTFANPRNAAAGSLRQLDSALCASRGLQMVIFNMQVFSEGIPERHSDSLKVLEELGFFVSPVRNICKNALEVTEAVHSIGNARKDMPYDTDGAVIKVDSRSVRKMLGSTSAAPRWAIAYKFPAEIAATVLRDIEIQVGRTGVLTPRARLDPVRISGSTVTYATLHNIDFIRQLDVRIGDTVRVRKAGEIIPEIVEVVLENRPAGTAEFVMPSCCPVCGHPVTRKEGEAATRCTNPDCSGQVLRKILHFVSRSGMNIDNLGESVVSQLVSSGLAEDVSDLYYLKKEDISPLDRMGDKSAQNIVDSIEKSKEAGLASLLSALGIRHIGEKAAITLAARFKTVYAVMEATEEELMSVDDIGQESAVSVAEFFGRSETKETVRRLAEAGVCMKNTAAESGDALAGLIFVVTGTLPTLSRTDAENLIRAHGGNASGSVSKKTSFLLCGENPGSKLTKAQTLGIPVIDEAELKKMIENKK